MQPRFAPLEQRVNAAVIGALTNALITIGAGEAQLGIFDNDYVLADIGNTGMAATAPAAVVETAGLPPVVVVGELLQVNYLGATTLWRIAEHHPDGTGLSTLLLERTA